MSRDYWKFFAGQSVSSFGSSFTRFALPLLVYQLTGSALNLALTTAATFLPVVLFGMLIGVWVDRANRKRLMILSDVGRAIVIASLPLLAALHLLSVWMIYAAAFNSSLLAMCFETGQFSAISMLVAPHDLARANGRLEASYSVTSILGSLCGGILVAAFPLPSLLVVDAVTFVVSGSALAMIAPSFNAEDRRAPSRPSVRADLGEGVRYVLGHRVLLSLAVMLTLFNFVSSSASAQLPLFAKQHLGASNTQVGLLYAAGSAGVVAASLAVGRVRRRWSYGAVALGCLMLKGALTVILALTTWYWPGALLWALISGSEALFNVSTISLLQATIPAPLMGRVTSVLRVLAWAAIALGVVVGGLIIDRTRQVALVYAAMGILGLLIPAAFWFTPLGGARRYLSTATAAD